MASLSSILRRARTIRRRQKHLPFGRALAYDFLRTQLMYKYVYRRLKQKPASEKLLGYKVDFFSYESFGFIMKEVFIDQSYYFQTKKKNPFIIDCGANIGLASLYFKKLYPESKVLCFEPDPDVFQKLETNIRQNNLTNIQAEQKALSSQNGKLTFQRSETLTGELTADHPAWFGTSSGHLKNAGDKPAAGEITVDTVKLSDYINEEVDFLKIDIEGAEHRVIEELAASGKIRHIKQLVMEYHDEILAGADRLSAMLRLLEENGFAPIVGGELPTPFQPLSRQCLLIYAYRKADYRQLTQLAA
ncbi:MAG: FkbM family methyltransferase [Dongiaceae bacterium]